MVATSRIVYKFYNRVKSSSNWIGAINKCTIYLDSVLCICFYMSFLNGRRVRQLRTEADV